MATQLPAWLRSIAFAVSVCVLVLSPRVFAQSRIVGTVRPDVKHEVPDSRPLLVARSVDDGRLDSSRKLGRMVLMLAPTEKQTRDAAALVAAQNDSSSPSYHKWLTPEQFGEKFGISAEDAASVESWLEASGFTVHELAKSRRFIVFSGNVTQVEQAFSTEMHSYSYNGNKFIANSTNIRIPAALAPVVKGVVRLHSEPHAPQMGQKIEYDVKKHQINGPAGMHFLSPADFAAIYNVKPLYDAGLDGTGQTIGIVSRSSLVSAFWNMDGLQDIRDFRQTMGLPANDPEIIVNGDDPFTFSYDDTAEAMLDVTWAGAVAPGAHIVAVASASSFGDGVDASAAYLVDHNLAPIMNTSFGLCESALGPVGNAFYAALWQQAAAQGITSFVSSGDSGGAGCDYPGAGYFASNGLAVNGIASTPYNVAVGGTQFDDVADPDAYWNTSSDPVTLQSVKGYIPEKVWNESSNDPWSTSLWAGGGGVSSIYAKPDWQSAAGVPNDGQRDVPDISLAASSRTGYAVCWMGGCASPDYRVFYTFGGTSASSPSVAAIMALVLQAMNGERQGVANYVLYRLATTSGVYRDIIAGDNKVPGPDGQYTIGYSADTGYDLATGLGTLDANALVTNWRTAAAAASSSTTLTLASSANVVHGSSINFQAKVSCTGTSCTAPTGQVALLASSGSGGNIAIGAAALTPGSPDSTADITSKATPGGTYAVTARYSGDGSYYSSTSNSVNVNVGPEPSQMAMGSAYSGYLSTAPATVQYGEPLPLFIAVAGNSGQGYPTGQVTLLTDGQPADVLGKDFTSSSPLTLNYGEKSIFFGDGTAPVSQSSTFPNLNWGLSVGAHQLSATYPGDNSFGSASTSFGFTVSKAESRIVDFFPLGTVVAGVPVDLMGQIILTNGGCAPYGGTVTITDNTTIPSVVLGSAPASELYCDSYTVPVTFTTAGTHIIRVSFTGDSNVSGSVADYDVFPVASNSYSYVSLYADVPSAILGNPVTLSAQVGSDVRKYTATGNIVFLDGTATLGTAPLDATGTATLVVRSLVTGVHNIFATYAGDSVLQSSSGGPIVETIADYIIQAPTSNLVISSGLSGSTNITIVPLGSSTQAVSLSCGTLPANFSCAFSPASVTLDGINPAIINVTVSTARMTMAQSHATRRLLGLTSMLALAGFWLPFTRRKHRKAYLGMLLMIVATLSTASCGGGSSNPNVAQPGTYVLTVNATSAGSTTKSVPLVVTVMK